MNGVSPNDHLAGTFREAIKHSRPPNDTTDIMNRARNDRSIGVALERSIMRTLFLLLLALLGLCETSQKSLADQPPSFIRDVKPFFARYCVECHNPDKLRGGLNLESFKSLEQGGDDGSVFLAGKPDESRIVLQVEGKAKPKMPPAKAKQPHPDELTVLRSWIAAGAKDDSASVKIALPSIKPRVPSAAPV